MKLRSVAHKVCQIAKTALLDKNAFRLLACRRQNKLIVILLYDLLDDNALYLF